MLSTSKLQEQIGNMLREYLGEYDIIENARPEWLSTNNGGRLEIDFLIPGLESAIEVQGQQHYQFVEFFHKDPSGFLEQIERDKEKKEICEARGIRLFHVINKYDTMVCIEEMLSVPYDLESAKKMKYTLDVELRTLQRGLSRLREQYQFMKYMINASIAEKQEELAKTCRYIELYAAQKATGHQD